MRVIQWFDLVIQRNKKEINKTRKQNHTRTTAYFHQEEKKLDLLESLGNTLRDITFPEVPIISPADISQVFKLFECIYCLF